MTGAVAVERPRLLRDVISVRVLRVVYGARKVGMRAELLFDCGHTDERHLTKSDRDAWARGEYAAPKRGICDRCRREARHVPA